MGRATTPPSSSFLGRVRDAIFISGGGGGSPRGSGQQVVGRGTRAGSPNESRARWVLGGIVDLVRMNLLIRHHPHAYTNSLSFFPSPAADPADASPLKPPYAWASPYASPSPLKPGAAGKSGAGQQKLPQFVLPREESHDEVRLFIILISQGGGGRVLLILRAFGGFVYVCFD